MSAFTWSWPSVRTFCSIFCCPPVPSRIAAKLAFVPPEPTYLITDSADSTHKVLLLSSSADWQFGQAEFDLIEPCTTTTSRSETIACIYIRVFPNARYTIMFSHGNAVDLGHMTSFLVFLSRHLRVNIFSYDYSGYGASSGSPSEANLYADAEAALLCLTGRYGVAPSSIVLYGQSIGTVPTVDLAAKHKDIAGVVLHSPLTSGMRIVFPTTKDTCFFDAFPSIDKVANIESPVLVIHGTEDEVIDISHGHLIYQRCPNKAEPLWVDGAGHNDIEQYHGYLERLIRFLEVDVPTG